MRANASVIMQPLEMDDGEPPSLNGETDGYHDEEEEVALVDGDEPNETGLSPTSQTRAARRRKQIIFWSFSSAAHCFFFAGLMFGIVCLFLFGMLKHAPEGQLTQCRDAFTEGQGWEIWKYAEGDLAKAEWCLRPESSDDSENTEECQCNNPLLPVRNGEQAWEKALQRNTELVQESMTQDRPLDMVLVGDSIVERWLGTQLGGDLQVAHKTHQVYQRLFRDQDSFIHGLALGIAGDRAPNLLYRLEQGEMPEGFNPPLWWVLVGTNDLFSSHCNVNATLAGILQVVEYILHHRKDAIVAIHSILPRGSKPLWSEENIYWKEISMLNHDLKCYSATNSRVEFFNATNLFLTHDKSRVNSTLMNDLLHPNEVGAIRWGENLVLKSMEYLGDGDDELEIFDNVNLGN